MKEIFLHIKILSISETDTNTAFVFFFNNKVMKINEFVNYNDEKKKNNN